MCQIPKTRLILSKYNSLKINKNIKIQLFDGDGLHILG